VGAIMLQLNDNEKSNGTNRAVLPVTLAVDPGTVLGLAGENGAGKSTLIKIVSGAVAADGGGMNLGGKRIAPRSTNEAMSLGIASVFQELTLVRELSVERNLFLTSAPTTAWGAIDRREMRRAALELLDRHKLAVDPAAKVGDLPLGQQQMIEIVRAVESRPRVLLLDEATSALGASEVAWLAELVDRLRRDDAIVLFISHRWDEIVRFCNRVAILRNGELVSLADTADVSEDQAVRLMSGEEAAGSSFPHKTISDAGVTLAAEGLHSVSLRGASLRLRKGEILGLGGLVGQGQGSLLEALFGAYPLSAGRIYIDGRPFDRPTPSRAIAAGLAYVPQERKTEGLLLSKSVGVNTTLAILRALRTRFGIIDGASESDLTWDVLSRAQVKTRGPGEAIRNLSGGNQQKVLLERWLLTRPANLLLNDVTRGVDVATKRHMYGVIADIARSGVGVIWYSTDARELVGVAHRVLVMRQGAISAELGGEALTVDGIVRASVLGNVQNGGDARNGGVHAATG
jgi:ribose transport system ATP-binding protein